MLRFLPITFARLLLDSGYARPSQRHPHTALAVMQPLDIAKAQANVIGQDDDQMYEVLEQFVWEFEKVCLPLSFRCAWAAKNIQFVNFVA